MEEADEAAHGLARARRARGARSYQRLDKAGRGYRLARAPERPLKDPFAISIALCAALAASSSAQERPPVPGAPRPQPPVFRPAEGGLGLVEAVRLTLAHDPRIRLQEAEMQGRAGIARELSGQFDLTLRGDGRFDYLQQELPESVKRQQRKDRQDLTDTLPGVESLADSLDALLVNLNDPRLETNPTAVDLTMGVVDPQTRIESLNLQTQLLLLTELINAASDPNLRRNLIDIRSTTIQQMRDQTRRTARDAGLIRTDLRNAVSDLGEAPVDEWQRRAGVHVDLVRQLRNGIVLSPFIDVTHAAQNFRGKEFTDIKRGGQGVEDNYRSEIGFDVVFPLLRGRGRTSVTAAERAAQVDYEASRLDYMHEKSRGVLETARAYWELRAATEALEVANRSVQLETDLLNLTQALVRARERARSDEVRVQASHADALARVAAAERRLSDARVNLARVMGVALEEGVLGAPAAADPFPEPPADLGATAAAAEELARRAMERRLDRRAAATREQAAEILVRGARKDTRMRLDLFGRVFGTATAEKRVTDLDRWVFGSANGGIELEKPFGNNLLLGRLAQRESSLMLANIESADVARTVALNVVRLVQSLRVAADQVRRAEEAVRFYDRTIVDEQAKLRAGDSTLVDTIFTEQQTTAAREALVFARRDYASLLAELRYEAGLLVVEGPDGGRVTDSTLTTLPPELRGAEPRP
jgi:outer membrane protein TolC